GGAAAQETLRAVPKATCGPSDKPEKVQGQVTMAERFAPGPAKVFNCNLELVSQYKGDGSGWGMIAIGDCVVMSTFRNDRLPAKLQNPGAVLLDLADSSKPRLIKILDSGAMNNVNESLDFSPSRKIMFGNVYQLNAETEFPIDLYDMSDCRNPKLLSSAPIN